MTEGFELVFHSLIGPETTATIWATRWSPRTCERIIQILKLQRKWMAADEYRIAAAQFSKREFFGMTPS